MYVPKYYKNENAEAIRAFINENGFTILINQVERKPWATHIPLIVDKDSREKIF